MGDSGDVLALERKSVQPYSSQDEYLWAMREDLADWFHKLYDLDIVAETFFERLETGVALCQHANNVQSFILQRLQENNTGRGHNQREATLLEHLERTQNKKGVQYRENVRPGTFQSRDNISNFIAWCRGLLGLPDCLLFETNDLVDLLNERSVILCLLEVARQGAKYGMEAPMLVMLENEIDAEIAGEEPAPTPRQRILNDHRSLDEMVRDLVSRCTCPDEFPMIRVSEGKYRIGDSQTLIFVRILRRHVMVRIGGGWDTLENYLDRHDPCRCDAKALHGPGKKTLGSPLKNRDYKKTPVKAAIDTGLSNLTKHKEVQPGSGRASPQHFKNVKQDTRRAMTPTKDVTTRRSHDGTLRPSTPNGRSRQNSTSDLSQCSDDSIPSVHSLSSSRGAGRNFNTQRNGIGVNANHSRSGSVEPQSPRMSPKISPSNSIKQKKKGDVLLIARDSSGRHNLKDTTPNKSKTDTKLGVKSDCNVDRRRAPLQKMDNRDNRLLPDKLVINRTMSSGSDRDFEEEKDESPTESEDADYNEHTFLATLPYENLPEPQPDEELHAEMQRLYEQLRMNELRRLSSSDDADGRKNGRATPDRGTSNQRRAGRVAPGNRRKTSSTSSAHLSPSTSTNLRPNLNVSRPRHLSRDSREPRQMSQTRAHNRARSVSPTRARQALQPLNFSKSAAKTKRTTGTRTEPSTPTSVRRALSMAVKQWSQDDLLKDTLNDTLNDTYPPSAPLRECHDKGAQTTCIDLPALEAAKCTPRKDNKHFGHRTRIPQPVKFGDNSSDCEPLKRYDSGVDINNVSPNDVNGPDGWPDEVDDFY